MSPRQILVDAIAVCVGAIIGKVVYDGLAALFFGADFPGDFTALGRWVTVFLAVGSFPVIYRHLPATPAALAAFFVGLGLPAIIFGLAFDSPLSWGAILFLCAVFSALALLIYRFVHANGTVRQVARDMTGPSDPAP